MNADAVDRATPASFWIRLTHTPTFLDRVGLRHEVLAGVSRPTRDLQAERLGERLEALEQLVENCPRHRTAGYRHIRIRRWPLVTFAVVLVLLTSSDRLDGIAAAGCIHTAAEAVVFDPRAPSRLLATARGVPIGRAIWNARWLCARSI